MTQTATRIAQAFKEGRPRTIKNTRTDGHNVWHHGNLIATKYLDGSVEVTLAGWPTVTTRDRLNAIAEAYGQGRPFYQSGFNQFYGDQEVSSYELILLFTPAESVVNCSLTPEPGLTTSDAHEESAMKYVIARKGYDRPDFMAYGILFDTAAEAQRHIDTKMYRDPRYEVRPATWRDREHMLQAYRSLPPWDLGVIPDHYAHVSKDDPSMIAFTASPEHGEADRQTRMKPGRYVMRFYPALTKRQVAFYAEWWAKGEKPRPEPEGELLFASTSEEIVQVYANGPASCMHGSKSVRVYGAGDLAIAHIQKDGEITARCLCWPDKGVFGRVYPSYGTNEGRDLYCRLREDKGWKHTEEHGDEIFNGARILRISKGHPEDKCFIMPFLDHDGLSELDEKYFVMNKNGWGCGEQSGRIYLPVKVVYGAAPAPEPGQRPALWPCGVEDCTLCEKDWRRRQVA